MRTTVFFTSFMLLVSLTLFATNTSDSSTSSTQSTSNPVHTTRDSASSAQRIQPTTLGKTDSLTQLQPNPADTSAQAKLAQQTGLHLVERRYDSKQQIRLATGMMIFVLSIITLAQQWNPR